MITGAVVEISELAIDRGRVGAVVVVPILHVLGQLREVQVPPLTCHGIIKVITHTCALGRIPNLQTRTSCFVKKKERKQENL